MVYRSEAFLAEGGVGGNLRSARVETESASFSPLEWQVVQLARQDSLATLREPGRWTRLQRLIFGQRPNPRLADRRLEALRQIAVEAWHRSYDVHPRRILAFLSAGFTDAHLERLLAAIAAMRGSPKLRSFA
ncbi:MULTISPECIES: hypothetical protein [Sphingobium]|uniref:hypothetical protein n=1 Tax=Sphingobium sp. MI1205 TaxID=407020 RepID=UPI000770342B|nr:hypothetical protein [Sphingobium sp. MI1205]AMK20082.1 hypothetical protein K663_18606 [Sphingobium sp. MI1205]